MATTLRIPLWGGLVRKPHNQRFTRLTRVLVTIVTFEWIFIDFPQGAFRLLLRFTRVARVLVTVVTFAWRQHYELHSGEVPLVKNIVRGRTPGFANYAFVLLLRITPSRRILVTISISLKLAFVYVLRFSLDLVLLIGISKRTISAKNT